MGSGVLNSKGCMWSFKIYFCSVLYEVVYHKHIILINIILFRISFTEGNIRNPTPIEIRIYVMHMHIVNCHGFRVAMIYKTCIMPRGIISFFFH